MPADQPYWALDPQREYSAHAWELLRCCLARTLFSYNGHPTDQGGASARPDLEARPPNVSGNGLRWKFHIKSGILYGPPLENVEVTAPDFVRALEREARVGYESDYGWVGPGFYYSVIRGFDAYHTGKADNISGLQTPDDHTLIVMLRHPENDLDYLFSLPATAPIPPSPWRQDAPFGAATGHGTSCYGPVGNCVGGGVTYGRFLVSTGPYALAGSSRLDLSVPPDAQGPISGYVPAAVDKAGRVLRPGSITLVRNPSWRRDTDPLRKAYVDRIQITLGGSVSRGAREVNRGRVDMVFDRYPDPLHQIRRYQNDSRLRRRFFTEPTNTMRWISINLATPPFDDIHVRRAVNYAIDKARLVGVDERATNHPTPEFAVPATHMAPDAVENGQLLRYDPFPTPGHRGSLRAARREMAKSKYDRDHDGVCDSPACKHIFAPVRKDIFSPAVASLISRNLRPLGLFLRVKMLGYDPFYHAAWPFGRGPKRSSLAIGEGFAPDYPNGATWFPLLFHGGKFGGGDLQSDTLVGASRTQLRHAGYKAASVPNVDSRIDHCAALVASEQNSCWAGLDKYLMEQVVPWVPLIYESTARTVSDRIATMSFDQFVLCMPALDQISLKRSAIVRPG
jgi:ABC-type transport system substrate-binding protein